MISEAGLQEVETYVSRRHNTVAQHIATRLIMDLCMAAKKRTGPRLEMQWWYQEGLDLEGMQLAAREAERTEEEEYTDGTKTANADY